jgi:uracil-DNA glycosylase
MQHLLELSWRNALSEEIEQEYFKQLTAFVDEAYRSHPQAIFPEYTKVFSVLNSCPIEEVSVVILGQDPYPTKGHANGLCFSVEENVRPLPKSLTNIFKEINTDLGKPIPSNGNLERWAKQGVLLLNSTLTVQEGLPNSHAGKGWEQFTAAVIRTVATYNSHVVYLLWGAKAQEKTHYIDPSTNLVLTAAHPSPLAAYRGFFGCKHFSTANAYLTSKGKRAIDW